MRVIGLTGGIASGKSLVSEQLAERGAALIDADKVGHAAYLKGTQAFDEVVAVKEKRRPAVGPDQPIGSRRPARPKGQDEQVEDQETSDWMHVQHSRIGEKLPQIAPHLGSPGSVGSPQVDDKKAVARQ